MESTLKLKLPMTAIVLTKNEEKAISECLDSIAFCDQIIVVDSESTDNTIEIAKNHGAEILTFVWNGTYPKKKQWSLQEPSVRNDWVLFLDADERVSPELYKEIQALFNNNSLTNYVALEIPLTYYFLRRELRFGHQVKKIAVLNRHFCSFPIFDDLHVSNMWEVEGHYQPNYSGELLKLRYKIIHNDPDGLFDYFARHNRYSDWEAALRTDERMSLRVRQNRTLQGQLFDRVPFKPFVFFIYSFILKSGWKDGRAGFNYAVALSFYYWQISIKSRERKLDAHTE